MKNIKTKFRRVFTFILGIIFVISVTILADMIRSRMDNKKVTDIGVQADTSLASTVGNFPLRYGNYFRGNVTSTSGEYLMQIKAPADASWSGLEITQGNSKYSSLYWTAPTKTVVSASNGTTWGQGVLDLWGNPVAANGKEISKKIQHKNVTIGNIQLELMEREFDKRYNVPYENQPRYVPLNIYDGLENSIFVDESVYWRVSGYIPNQYSIEYDTESIKKGYNLKSYKLNSYRFYRMQVFTE